jgi:hypothetical protein
LQWWVGKENTGTPSLLWLLLVGMRLLDFFSHDHRDSSFAMPHLATGKAAPCARHPEQSAPAGLRASRVPTLDATVVRPTDKLVRDLPVVLTLTRCATPSSSSASATAPARKPVPRLDVSGRCASASSAFVPRAIAPPCSRSRGIVTPTLFERKVPPAADMPSQMLTAASCRYCCKSPELLGTNFSSVKNPPTNADSSALNRVNEVVSQFIVRR